jgi:hypothetical protein
MHSSHRVPVQQFVADFSPPMLLKRFAAIRMEVQMAARSVDDDWKRQANSFVTGFAFTSSRGWLRWL